ncbi:hypothetical protein JAAARDRAFT_199712 [Jaapia argillacea MUCL 33604]|uniref:Uncharacterized protein n=1 Tax=Jaapia argillacea MUCL 33604 TaxID=933084 RepID=A0A067PA62_9AGAM|nr:hypothetical protein JAAARDRAFT_199712 [Jaapia argillacea MUCL 33604]
MVERSREMFVQYTPEELAEIHSLLDLINQKTNVEEMDYENAQKQEQMDQVATEYVDEEDDPNSLLDDPSDIRLSGSRYSPLNYDNALHTDSTIELDTGTTVKLIPDSPTGVGLDKSSLKQLRTKTAEQFWSSMKKHNQKDQLAMLR